MQHRTTEINTLREEARGKKILCFAYMLTWKKEADWTR